MEQIGLQGVFDVSNFDAGMKEYSAGLARANEQTEKTAGGIGSAFASIGSSVTGVMGGLVVGAMSQAASAVAGFLPGAINAASDLNETVSKVGVVFGDNSKQVLDWAKNAATAMGQSQQQALAAAGTFGNLFVAMGMNSGKSAEMSEGLVKLAGDLASFNNIDPTVALEKLRAGISGESEPLKSLGVNMNAAMIEAKAMQLGLVSASVDMDKVNMATSRLNLAQQAAAKAMREHGASSAEYQRAALGVQTAQQGVEKAMAGSKVELTAAQKAQASYALIMEQTKVAQGDFARTADGYANGQRIIAAQMADITATIGSAFLPIVVKLTGAFASFLSGVAPGITEWFTQLGYAIDAFTSGDVADINWENLAPAWLVPTLQQISTILDGAFRAVSDFANGLGGLDYPWEDVFPPTLANLAYGVSSAIKFVIDNLAAFEGAIAGVGAVLAGAGIYSALTGIAAAIAAINLPIVAIIGAAALLGAAWASDWGGIQEIVIPIIQSIMGWLQQMQYVLEAFASGDVADINWENVAPAWLVPALQQISLVLDGAFRAISDFSAGLGGFNYDWSKVFPPTVATLAQGVSDAIKSVIDAFAPLASAIATNGAGALQELQNFVTGNQTSFDNVKAIWEGATTTASTIFSGLADAVTSNLPGFIEAVGEFGTAALDWLGDAAGKIAGALGPWASALVSGLANHLPEWIAGFANYITESILWLEKAAGNLPGAISKYISALVSGISGGKGQLSGGFAQWAAAAIDWLDKEAAPKAGPAVGRLLGTIVGALVGGVAKLLAAGVELAAGLIKGFLTGDFNGAGVNSGNLIIKGIQAVGHLFVEVAKGFAKGFIDAFGLAGWAATGEKVMSDLKGGIDGKTSSVVASATTAAQSIKGAFTTGVNWVTDVGGWLTGQIGAGVVAGGPGLNGKGTSISTALHDTIIKAAPWLQLGIDIITAIGNGLAQAASTLYSKAKSIATELITNFSAGDWKSIGEAIINGISAGIDSLAGQLKSKIDNLLGGLVDKAKGLLGIESPSKVFAEIGRNIVEGMIVGIDQRAGALRNQMRSLSMDMINFGPSGALMEWSRALDAGRRPLADYENSFSNLLSLGKAWTDANPTLPQNYGATIKALTRLNQGLDTRVKLLDIIKENNFNPEMILGLGGGNIADATPLQLAQAINRSASALASMTANRIRQEQEEIQRTWQLRGAMAAYNAQLDKASDLGENAMNFFQKIEFSQLTDQFADLGRQLQEAQAVYTQTGDTGALTRLNDLIAQRAGILEQMQALQHNVNSDTVKRGALQDILNQQKQMLDQAETFGYNLQGVFNGYFNNSDQLSSDALRAMARLQDQLDQSALEQTMKEIASKVFLGGIDTNTGISGVASAFGSMYATTVLDPILEKLHNVVLLEDERNAAIAQYNQALAVTKGLQQKQDNLDFLQAQLDLISKATGAGLSLGSIFQGITLGPGASITNMLTASNRLMDALIKKSQDQLTPQALALQDKQTQLANLKAQLDLYNQAKDAGLDVKAIFQGITLGINATTADILTATTRLTDALIGQVKDDLKIHSPSRVMMDIGANIVRGLGAGMQKAFSSPLMSASTVATGPVSNRALTINMGGVNNYTPMDDLLFEAKIQRVVERAFRGG